MYMLDTNICIYAIKNKPETVLRRVWENMGNGLCISAITLAELEHGVAKSSLPVKNQAALTRFLAVMDVLSFDGMAAGEYGRICAYLQRKGSPIGTMDMLIAGHALAKDRILVTNNVKEFERVPGLRIENWTE